MPESTNKGSSIRTSAPQPDAGANGTRPPRRDGSAIGASPPRLDAADKASGRARYADDIRLPGMLHAALLTSPHAHARILGYRLDAARASRPSTSTVQAPQTPWLQPRLVPHKSS